MENKTIMSASSGRRVGPSQRNVPALRPKRNAATKRGNGDTQGVKREVQHMNPGRVCRHWVAAEKHRRYTGVGRFRRNQISEACTAADSGDSAKHARSTANPFSSSGHGRPAQRERRVARHGIVFLGCRESEKIKRKPVQQSPGGSVRRGRPVVGKLGMRKVDAPWKYPQRKWNSQNQSRGTVCSRAVAQIQEAKKRSLMK